jgi:hypothetical protein
VPWAGLAGFCRAMPGRTPLRWSGLGRPLVLCTLGHANGFGPVVGIQIKSFIFFLFNSDSIQILENHIYSNIAPKIMKPILLDS